MWALFGTSFNSVEQEPFVYFIGVFDDIQLAHDAKTDLVLSSKQSVHNFFIKPLSLNQTYTYEWSNYDDTT